MRSPRSCILVILAVLAPVAAFCQPPPSLITCYGAAWETGGFPPSNLGEFLFAVGLADSVNTGILSWDPAANEYTVYLTGLESQGQVEEDGILHVFYSNGRLTIYEDPARNADFGSGTPPNATSPWTFTDGTAYLSASASSFEVRYDPLSGAGTLDAQITFSGGSHLGELGGARECSLSGTLGPALGPLPPGYHLWVDGRFALVPTAVREGTWGRVKAGYR